MTKDLTAIKRYAKALYEACQERGIADQAIGQMREVSAVLADPELLTVLTHPNIDASVKTGVLQQVFQGKVADEVLNLLLLLVERKRAEQIPAVYGEFVKIVDEAMGRAEAVVYSHQALNAQETSSIQATFSTLTGKTVHVTNIIDTALLGGIKVSIGDKLYDGSLSGKLKRLEKELQASQAL